MAKQEQFEEQGERQPSRLVQAILRWRPLLLVATVVLFVAGAIVLWRQYGESIIGQSGEKYGVELAGFEVTPQPDWIKCDVRREVYVDAGWENEKPSILETDLTLRVAQAFEQHTWVESVSQVTKHHPARVTVQIQYRRPVAMVEVDYQGQPGLLPVDRHGVLLPPDDFTAEQATTYPRITIDYSGPQGSVGTQWGDPRVAEAARIAALLEDDWKMLDLHRIQLSDDPAGVALAQREYELHTREKTRILWGHAPDDDVQADVATVQKIAKLRKLAEGDGGLGAGDQARVIDLRDAQKVGVRSEGIESGLR